MLQSEGFYMFRGVMKITPRSSVITPFEIEADWLYKPEHDCWYGKGHSYPASICEVVKDYTEEIHSHA